VKPYLYRKVNVCTVALDPPQNGIAAIDEVDRPSVAEAHKPGERSERSEVYSYFFGLGA